MLVQILIDNPFSWIIPYANSLSLEINSKMNYTAVVIHSHEEVIEGNILCLLSCEKIFKNLHLNKHNLVVHESDLPKGKGWSPVTWQILENSTKIPVSLFEAAVNVDSGPIYFKDYICLDGSELLPEIRAMQGKVTNKLVMKFLDNYPNVEGLQQSGEETFYEKRTERNSEVDINRSIKEVFNLLRVCDNKRYPAFFVLNDVKYVLKIEKSL